KYAFVDGHREEFPVELMCRVLGISKSGYFAWTTRDHSPRESRRNELVVKIEKIHKGSRNTYGSPRVFRILKGMGESCSKATVERLMREHGIRSKVSKKYRATTDSNHSQPVAPNHVK